MSKFCDVILFLSFNYKLLWNAVLRLSDIPLQAIVGAKKQNDCLVDTDPTAANSNQIIIGSCWHSHMFNIVSELSCANQMKFTKQLASCKDTVYRIAY